MSSVLSGGTSTTRKTGQVEVPPLRTFFYYPRPTAEQTGRDRWLRREDWAGRRPSAKNLFYHKPFVLGMKRGADGILNRCVQGMS